MEKREERPKRHGAWGFSSTIKNTPIQAQALNQSKGGLPVIFARRPEFDRYEPEEIRR